MSMGNMGMSGGIEKLNRQMSHLLGIQMEVLKTMKATKPVVEATTKAMDNLGESTKEVGKEIEETQTKLGKFIETKLRATSGAAGIFHKVMYGVPGYFIFKNRMDTLLSGIDKFVLQPMSGNKKDGFLNKVLYGVGGSYRKSKEQIERIFSMAEEPTFAGLFDAADAGTLSAEVTSKPRVGIGGKIKGKAEEVSSKAIKFYKMQDKMKKFNAFLGAKGTNLGKMAMGSLKVLMTMGLVVMKYLIVAGLAITGVFVLIKLLRKAGLDGAKLKEIGLGMYNIAKHFVVKIWENLTKMKEGLLLIYDFVFGDGTFGDLIEGYIMVIGGFIGAVWNLFLAIVIPIYYAGIEILKVAIIAVKNGILGWIQKKWEQITYIAQMVGSIVVFIATAIGFITSSPVWITAAIVTGVVGAVVALAGLLGELFSPFANGGVTKSGLSLVGERGPELVRLPNGSRVHTNQESKRMMAGGGGNNITVNIQGRIGASDSELRQIAQKVGQMINKEINRTTSSRGLGA